MNWDHNIFLLLNFDGGESLDAIMTFASGKVTWVPLYISLLYLIWRKGGWRLVMIFALCVIAAVGLSDIIAGIFKHSGPLKHLWDSFPVRLRPMHTPELEGLIHKIGSGGRNGTVSAHAATTASIAIIAACELRKRWLTISLIAWVLLVSYSRIYLAYHFPQDILLGWATGALCAIIPYQIFKAVVNKKG
ncbi:MAG: phosphatase PAP2 family protein [Rikenellaceae bacterium]